MRGFAKDLVSSRGNRALIPIQMPLEMELGMLFGELIAEITEKNREVGIGGESGIPRTRFLDP
jgi:hypothetical protein